ncbi:substrate-binding domain-containing protein [Clostridium frigoriphilum]|uniref:substrate-binding domain-containing protein n=1 Tax=Clostridium frigoriphilum TaxID=443253 RepID=UPI0038B3BBFA
MNDSGIKTEQLAMVNANWSKEFAENSIESLILTYNGRIEAIISNNDAMAIGAVEALQKYGYNKEDKSKYVSVFGIDALLEAKDLIDNGYMMGTICHYPRSFAEGVYIIGMNLINNENPIENANYKIQNGSIVIPISYQEYIEK